MRHAYKSNASAVAPSQSEGNDPGFPTDGDTANDVPVTVFGTYWAHAASSEIVNVITEGGLVPGNALNQMSAAIAALISTAFGAISAPAPPDFASRNEHIQAIPPGDEFANPRDSLFAIRAYFAARA